MGKRHIVARLKGPEFLVGVEEARRRRSACRCACPTALARPFAIDGALVAVGARVGVATARAGESGDALLRRANDALDDARASDGATIRIAGEPAIADALSVDLRRAIEGGEIDVLFQPQVAIATGRITGVEALARWEHPDVRRRSGRINCSPPPIAPIWGWRCPIISSGSRSKPPRHGREALAGQRLSINLTAADIARPGFADIFLDRVDAARFARARLTVEITESGLIDDLGAAAQLLATLAPCRVPRRDRRFRHGLFEPRLSQGVAARLSQDRQEARAGHRRHARATAWSCAA